MTYADIALLTIGFGEAVGMRLITIYTYTVRQLQGRKTDRVLGLRLRSLALVRNFIRPSGQGNEP